MQRGLPAGRAPPPPPPPLLLLLLLASESHAYSSRMLDDSNCNVELSEGSYIMSNPALRDGSEPTPRVTLDGVQVQHQGTVPAGAVLNIEFQVDGHMHVIETSLGSFGLYTSGCGGTRTTSATPTLTVPLGAQGQTVVLRAGFASDHNVKLAQEVWLTVGPPLDRDCAGSFDPCTTACEAAAARVWTESAAQSGNGAACASASACQPGEDACAVDTDCAGSFEPCTTACEAAAARVWTESAAQTGHGAACTSASACQPGGGSCPVTPHTDCEGSWAACTSCEIAADRIWMETAAQSGSGTTCPSAVPCQPGQGGCPEREPLATPVVSVISTVELGGSTYATYRLSVALGPAARSVYSVHGTPDQFGLDSIVDVSGSPSPIIMPPAYHVAAPFGVDIGGVSPSLFVNSPEAQYDSWLTIGQSEGNIGNELATVGIDFITWTESFGLEVVDGAVFCMTPDIGGLPSADGTVLVAQITIPTGTTARAQLSVQGNRADDNTFIDWRVDGLVFELPHGMDTDCAGSFAPCTTACEAAADRAWAESAAQSGNGAACASASACQPGEGSCPVDTDCEGSWAACTAICEKVFSVMMLPSGRGALCEARDEATFARYVLDDGATFPCEAGVGSCPRAAPSCTAGSGDRAMYLGGAEFSIGTTVGSLGTLACAAGHGRTDPAVPPSVLCSEGNNFLFRGCEADVNCEGTWSVCTGDCSDKVFTVKTAETGQGAACRVVDGSTMPCHAGDGSCPKDVKCVGAWSACDAACSPKTYAIVRPQSGHGAQCAAVDGASSACSPGEGECPPNVDCIGSWSGCDSVCSKQYTVTIANTGGGPGCEAAHMDTLSCATDDPCDDDNSESMDDVCVGLGDCQGVVVLGGELSYPLTVTDVPEPSSPARQELETSITTNLVSVLTAGGLTCSAGDIDVFSITAGSVNIEYTVSTPPALATEDVQASAAAALADPPAGTSMSITIGGETSATAQVEPFKSYSWVKAAVTCEDACGTDASTVTDTYACSEDGVTVDGAVCTANGIPRPATTTTACPVTGDCDCQGSWSTCAADCSDKTFTVTQHIIGMVGDGQGCEASAGAVSICVDGEGWCADVNCVGAWSVTECQSDCVDREYSISTAQVLGGTHCDAIQGATLVCNPGDGACPPPAPQDDPTYVPPDVDCDGSFSGCTVACESEITRVWNHVASQSGSGMSCGEKYGAAQACQPGEDDCPVNTDCEGSWVDCTGGCEVAADRVWTEVAAQSGSGTACPSPPACSVGDGACEADEPEAPEAGSVEVTLTLSGALVAVAGAAGSNERAQFEASFAADVASILSASGPAVASSQITITGIVGGSVVVTFEVATSPGGSPVTVSAVTTAFSAAITLPTVGVATTGAAEATIVGTTATHCEGSWSACTSACTRSWLETQTQSGDGSPCPAFAATCEPGDDDCVATETPAVDAGSINIVFVVAGACAACCVLALAGAVVCRKGRVCPGGPGGTSAYVYYDNMEKGKASSVEPMASAVPLSPERTLAIAEGIVGAHGQGTPRGSGTPREP